MEKLSILNAGQNYRLVGGSDRYFMDLEALLKKNGHDVVPFAANHSDNVQTDWKIFFPKANNFNNPDFSDVINFIYSKPAQRSLRNLLKENQFDLAHLHIYYGQLTGSILKALEEYNIPIVQTLHEYKLVCPVYSLYRNESICDLCKDGKFYHGLIHRCNRNSISRSALSILESYVSRYVGAISKINKFICVSNYQRSLIENMGIPSNKLLTVHNFVRAELFRKAEGQGKYVLYFGRLEKIKGIFTLLEAATKLPRIRFVIVGHGTDAKLFESFIVDRSIKNVDFFGFKSGEELEIIIANCRFSILPTEWPETFGLTVLETFMKGRPVVASRIGGVQEVIDEGIDGCFFEAGNVDGLCNSIESLWMNPDNCMEMGRQGQIKALTTFGPDTHYENLMKVYSSVL